DTMTTRNVLTGVTGPKPAPFTLEPEQAVASLDRIEGVDATWLLPGHGPAWDGGVPEAVRLIRETAAEYRRERAARTGRPRTEPLPGGREAGRQVYPNRRSPCQAGCCPKSMYRVRWMTRWPRPSSAPRIMPR